MLNRTQAPPIKDAVEYPLSLKPYQSFTLRNGVEIYSVEAGPQDVLQLELVFDAGNAFEHKNLVAASANYLLKNGTSHRNAFQINEHFEYYGAYLNRSCFNETSNLVLHTLNSRLEDLLPVMREMLTDSIFPQEEFDIYRQNMQQKLAVSLKKAEFVANRLIDVSLFGKDHPYGRFTTAEAYNALTRQELVDFYATYYMKGRCRIFVAGRLPKNTNALLDRYFGDLAWTNQPVPLSPAPLKPDSVKKARVTNDPDGLQGAIRMASPFPDKHHPDFPKAQVLNTIFGGYFGSRLMNNIREEKGYTYGIHSYLQAYMQESAWMIATEAGKEVCEATVTEVYAEMERLRNEPVGDEELQLVRNYLIGTLLGDLDGPFHIIGRWKNLVLHGLDESYFYNTIDLIKTIPARDLQELANQYLQPDLFYELIVT